MPDETQTTDLEAELEGKEAVITFRVTDDKMLVTAEIAGLGTKTCDLTNTVLAPDMVRVLGTLMIGLQFGMAPVVDTVEPF